MKIIFLRHIDKESLDEEVEYSLIKLGHKVISIDDEKFEPDDVIKQANESDLFLFRTGGVSTDSQVDFYNDIVRLQYMLNGIKTKKVFWFLDAVVGLGITWMQQIIPMVDYGFLNDDTFLRRNVIENCFPLHLGCTDRKIPKGNINPKYKGEIAFCGAIYLEQDPWLTGLKQEYGKRFKIYKDLDGQEFADLCASNKVVVSQRIPNTDFFWSDKLYKTLANGGLLVYPRLEGQLDEGFRNGVQYVNYSMFEECVAAINYFLEEKNEEARQNVIKAGKEFVLDYYKFSDRLEELFETIK